MTIADTLKALEESLLDGSIRKDTAKVSAMLTDNFKEFGASARIYSKQEIIAFLSVEGDFISPTVEAFHVELQTPDMALVTYRSVRATGSTLRTSVWVRSSDIWQMLFHQGTTVNNPER